MRLFDLTGRVAVVTGGGRGLGHAIAAGLAEAGATLVLAGRTRSELDDAVAGIAAAGGRAHACAIDLLDPDGPARLIEEAARLAGPVDILVHAAGTQVRKPAAEITAGEWDGVLDLHLKAAFLLAQGLARHLAARGAPGKVILVGSLNTHIGLRHVAPYAAAKAGLAGLARVLAHEWAEAGICVNTIIPGYYRTALTEDLFADPAKHDWVMSRIPMRRLGQPSDLAGAAIFLASAASDYVTGAEIRVDGGWLAA